jgi:hypothetical protein
MFVILSRSKPLLSTYTLPPQSVCLVFEPIPEGYRKAYEWITKRGATQHKDAKVYRVLIPCTADKHVHDLAEYELLAEPKPEFKGTIESWPDSTVFEIQAISNLEDTLPSDPHSVNWPFPSQGRVFDIWAGGYCSERALYTPHLFTGLTTVQQFILDECSQKDSTRTVQEIVALTAAHFRIDPTAATEQIEALRQGQSPWILSTLGKTLPVLVRKGYPDPLLPFYLLNGPFPYPATRILHYFKETIVEGKRLTYGADERDVVPSCPNYTFVKRQDGTWIATSTSTPDGTVRLPYGMSLVEGFKSLSSDDEEVTVELSWSRITVPDPEERSAFLSVQVPIIPKLRFHTGPGGHTLVTFQTVSEYIDAWKQEKIKFLMEENQRTRFQRSCRQKEREFLRTLFVQAKFEDELGRLKRVFVDESEAEKRQRLEVEYGEEYVEPLCNIPIYKLGGASFAEGEPEPVSARDRWANQLAEYHT